MAVAEVVGDRNTFADLGDADRDVVLEALYALEHAAGLMSAVDVSNAEANLAEVRYRPLTTACIEAATKLRERVQEAWSVPTGEHAGEVHGEVVNLR